MPVLPLPDSSFPNTPDEDTMFNVAQMQSLPGSSSEIEGATHGDLLLSRVQRYVSQGWPQKVPEATYPYWLKRNELTVDGDTMLWRVWVVVLRGKVLDEFHQGHPGVIQMKALGCSYVWWHELE